MNIFEKTLYNDPQDFITQDNAIALNINNSVMYVMQ